MQTAQPDTPEAIETVFEAWYRSDIGNDVQSLASAAAAAALAPALQVLTYKWNTAPPQGAMISPFTDSVIEQTVSSVVDYNTVWQNKTGSVSCLQEPSRFFMQSPHDDWGFYSFAVCVTRHDDNARTFKSLMVYSESPIPELFRSLGYIPYDWRMTDLPMVVVPLAILRHQVQQTSQRLANLVRQVEEVESIVAAGSQTADFSDLVQKLHSCNTNLIKLERRWHFQDKLASSIQDFINVYKSPVTRAQNITFSACRFEGMPNFNFQNEGERETGSASDFQNDTYFRKLESDCILQGRLSRAAEYDLSVLPRRISNQSTTIYNLIAQRDTKATIELAAESHKIAQAALGESSSMKTVAAMTLIFLPGTFICSFFSMSFFNWHAGPGESITSSLWIYFTAAVPLTALVILAWIFCTRRSRKKVGKWVLKRRVSLLPTFEEKSRTID